MCECVDHKNIWTIARAEQMNTIIWVGVGVYMCIYTYVVSVHHNGIVEDKEIDLTENEFHLDWPAKLQTIVGGFCETSSTTTMTRRTQK